MYHQFVSTKTEINSNNELHKLISHYNGQLKHSENTLKLLYTQKNIHIDMVVDNNEHNTKLYMLSNGKVLRHDKKSNSVCQLQGFQGQDILQMKALEIGKEERYVLLTDEGISVCTIRREEEIRVKVVQQAESEQKMIQQQSQQVSKSIKINTLYCEVIGSVFIQQPNQNNWHEQDLQQEQQQQQQGNIDQGTKYRQLFIINKSNNNELEEKRNEEEIDGEFALIVVVSVKGSKRDMAAYKVNIREREMMISRIEEQVEKQIIVENNNNKQINKFNTKLYQQCQIRHLLFPNNSYSISLLLTDTITQLEDANFFLSRTHPLIKVDHQICPLSNSFSIYFATQSICYWVQPQQWKHHIFEFQFCLNYDNQLKYGQKQWKVNSSTILLYRKKNVLTPRRVYSLPLLQHQSTILKYFTIKKTLSHQTQSPTTYLNSTITKGIIQSQIQTIIKITVVLNQDNDNQITFLQTQLKITKGNNKQTLFGINQQNLSFYSVIKPKFILRDILMLDCINKYAILLVNENSLGIQLSDNKEFFKQTIHLKLIIINLTPNIPQTDNIVSQIQLDYPLNDNICNSLNDNICNLSLFILKKRSILTPQLSSTLINKFKQIGVTYSQIMNNQIRTQQIMLVPKTDIYLMMLNSVLYRKQNGEVNTIDIKEDHQEFSRESFANSVIQLLSI